MEKEENEFQKIDTFTDLLKHFKKCLKAKKVKERPNDLGYFFMEAINEVLPKKHVKIESPEAIEAIKKEWALVLRDLSVQKRRAYASRFLGKKLKVLVEKAKDKKSGLLKGFSQNYLPFLLSGNISVINKIVAVQAEKYQDGKLYGKIINK